VVQTVEWFYSGESLCRALRISRESLERLRELADKHPEVAFLAVTGSVARRGFSVHDVDIAVKLSEAPNRYGALASILTSVSRALGVPEECIDLVDLDRADVELKASILRNSIVVIDRGYYAELIKELEVLREYGELRELSIREWLYSCDPTSIDVSIVKRRFDLVKSEIEFLENYILGKPVGEVKSSPILSRALERSYQLIVEALADIARHIVSSMGWSPCFTASECIERLAEKNVIPEQLAEELVRRVKTRNILIHRYLEVDYDELFNDAPKLIDLAHRFERHVVEFLRSIHA